VRIGEDPWQEDFKINAAQASHLGRIARECCACSTPHQAARCALAKPRSRRNARFWRTLQATHPRTLVLRISTRSDCEASSVSPTFKEDRLRRPQRPSFLNAPRRIFENPPAGSPSRTAGHHQPCRSRQQAQCNSRLHYEHFARRADQSQRKTNVELCRSCGG